VGGFSHGLSRASGAALSVEKDFGSKPSGDGDRISPLAGKVGARGDPRPSEAFLKPESDVDIGDTEAPRLIGSPGEEMGDISSGFAIRKPPRVWARFRSPSMLGKGVDGRCHAQKRQERLSTQIVHSSCNEAEGIIRCTSVCT